MSSGPTNGSATGTSSTVGSATGTTSIGSLTSMGTMTAAGWKGSIRVLLVDPDERFGRLLKGFLDGRGWQVEWVGDGRKALSRWKEIGPDLVVAELQGEDLDGFEFIETVSRMKKPPPIVVCTRLGGAHTWTPDALETLGVKGVVVRPIRFDQLASELERVILGG